MMFVKLALKNIKNSISNYAIYFVTIVFGVCLFYVFNSIDSQTVMLEVNNIQEDMIKMIGSAMSGLSLFIAFVLGGLIVYANKFLIKKRKKEFAVYMTLGMSKRKLSQMLLIETLIIGTISLMIGIGLGVVVSQGLSSITVNMFDIDITEYKFVFSSSAMIKSIIYFSVIYLIVFIFNAITISKNKLIKLLKSSSKNETIKVRRQWLSVVLFILAVIMIGIAYYCAFIIGTVLEEGLLNKSVITFFVGTIAGSIGTFLFIYSVAGFVMTVISKTKKIYFKNINIFTVRQLNTRINTNTMSMCVVSIMLFLAIFIFSVCMNMKVVFNDLFDDLSTYDAMYNTTKKNYEEIDLKADIESRGYVFDDKDTIMEFNYYELSYDKYDLFEFKEELLIGLEIIFEVTSYDSNIVGFTESHYNELCRALDMEEVNLEQGDILAIVCNDNITSKNNIVLDEKEFNIIQINNDEQFFEKALIGKNYVALIFKDQELEELDIMASQSLIGIDYNTKNKEILKEKYNQVDDVLKILDEELAEAMEDISTNVFFMSAEDFERINEIGTYSTIGLSRKALEDTVGGIGLLLVYVGIYIGFVFLITSVAILALQQLSETTDSIDRYIVLRKLGTSKGLINRSVFTQVAVYFFFPLLLAVAHVAVIMKVINELIFGMEQFANLIEPTLITSGALIIIYGGYFILTYLGCKKVINTDN